MRSKVLFLLLAGALVLGGTVTLPVWPQSAQPLPPEAAKELVKAALVRYFDPASVFEISLSGAALSGDVVSIEDLTVIGKPALVGDSVESFLPTSLVSNSRSPGRTVSRSLGRPRTSKQV